MQDKPTNTGERRDDLHPLNLKKKKKASSSASAPDAAASKEQRSHLAAAARALLETDLSASLGLFPAVDERVFSPASAAALLEEAEGGGGGGGGSSSEAALAGALSSLAAEGDDAEESLRRKSTAAAAAAAELRRSSRRSRSRRRALSGLLPPLNRSSIISEDDVILPDDALVRKILSKDAAVERNLVAGLANLTRSGAFKEMLRAELQALSQTPRRVADGARAAGNATKAAWSYGTTVKLNGTNSALAQQQRETVARAVFRVLAVPRDVGEFGSGGGGRREKKIVRARERQPSIGKKKKGLAAKQAQSLEQLHPLELGFSTLTKRSETCA